MPDGSQPILDVSDLKTIFRTRDGGPVADPPS